MIDDLKLQQVIGFTPHEKQKEVLESKARDLVICAGRRFGKSAICAYQALRVLLEDEKKIWIVSPTYDLSQRVFDYLARWYLKVAPSQAGAISYRPFPTIRTPRGSKIECKSVENPASLLGEELDLQIVDEAPLVPRRIWETNLFPATSSRKGRMIFIGTPRGKNWFFEQWMRVNEEGGAFRFRSIDNPYFPKEEWERAKGLLPEHTFRQEYEAMFIEGAASVFRGIRDIIGKCLEDFKKNHFYVMGVDLGKYRDFTVITVIDSLTHNVVYWDRFKEISWPLQKARIASVARRYNARVILDSTGLGDPISEDLQREGLIVDDFKFTNVSKQQLIEKLSLFIEDKAITIPDNQILLDELEAFGYELTESGKLSYQAPAGLHDDCVVSLGLAVWGLASPRRKKEDFFDILEQRKTKHAKFQYV